MLYKKAAILKISFRWRKPLKHCWGFQIRSLKKALSWQPTFAISLPPSSCLQCGCEGRSSMSYLVIMRAWTIPCGGVHSWGKPGPQMTLWHLYPCPDWSLLSISLSNRKVNPFLAYLRFQTQHNPDSDDDSS